MAESLAPGVTVSEVARRHDVHPNLLHWWRRQARQAVAPATNGRLVPVRIATDDGSAPAKAGGGRCSAAIEVQLVNGMLLRVPEGASAGRTAQLVAALLGLAR